MPTDVDACNLALTRLGAAPIADLNEDSDRARLCHTHLPQVRRAVFRAHKWNALMKRASLAQLVETPAWGYAFQYELPADCLRVVSTDLDDLGLPWKIEGRRLLTDEGSVSVLYIADSEDYQSLDPSLFEAISARLCAELAIPVTDSRSVSRDMWELAAAKLQEARAMDGQEGTTEETTANVLIDVRS